MTPRSFCHIAHKSLGRHTKNLLCHLVNAAKACVTLCWGDSKPPSIVLWLNKVRNIGALEDLVISAQNRKKQYIKTWSVWDQFIYSEEGRKTMEGRTVE